MEFVGLNNKESNSALIPIYFTRQPNHFIQLYQGYLQVFQKESVYEIEGSITLEWLPSPYIKFRFLNIDINNKSPYQIQFGRATIKFPGFENSAEILHSENSFSSEIDCRVQYLSGKFIQPITLGSEQNLSYILFHLTNFHNFKEINISASRKMWSGRFILEAEGWITEIENTKNIKNLINHIKSQGGYVITHVGKLERSDKKPFNAEEAKDILEALHCFFSFARGFSISPILLVGYNSNGEKNWEQWSVEQVVPWKRVPSWFPMFKDIHNLSNLFPGFLRCWQDNTWNQTIKLAIHWYLESNSQAGGIQGSIVLMQAAFELLSWTLLVEEKSIISQDGFNKLPAADQLRLLLSQYNIFLKVPNSLSNLLQAARELNWVDGSQALTEIRNAIVHPNPKKRQRILDRPFAEQLEAYQLGLWYLEVILLKVFDYKGNYFNRIANNSFYSKNIEFIS